MARCCGVLEYLLLLEFVGLGTARQALGTLESERLVLGPQGSM